MDFLIARRQSSYLDSYEFIVATSPDSDGLSSISYSWGGFLAYTMTSRRTTEITLSELHNGKDTLKNNPKAFIVLPLDFFKVPS